MRSIMSNTTPRRLLVTDHYIYIDIHIILVFYTDYFLPQALTLGTKLQKHAQI
jgi:hypothetical protein